MPNLRLTLPVLLLLVSVLGPVGCDRSKWKTDKALAEAERAKAELETVRAALETVRSEKDQLALSLLDVTEKLDQAGVRLTAVVLAQERLQNQVADLMRRHGTTSQQAAGAQNTVRQLRAQLNERQAEIREYDAWAKELQATIAELETQISAADQTAYEEPSEELEGGSEEQPADENSL